MRRFGRGRFGRSLFGPGSFWSEFFITHILRFNQDKYVIKVFPHSWIQGVPWTLTFGF